MTGFLASVASVEEAKIVLAGGADIIDLKNPHSGALGALPLSIIAETVDLVSPYTLTSATIGDLSAASGQIPGAVRAMISTRVDFIKIGFFSQSGDLYALIDSLDLNLLHHKLVAVLFADQHLDYALLPRLASAGFHGVMLDTATKAGSGLCSKLSIQEINMFVQTARKLGLVTGLAGQLRATDIPSLLPLEADYLGFRSALCARQQRRLALDSRAIETVRGLIPGVSQSQSATEKRA